jgi:hypothetical protein
VVEEAFVKVEVEFAVEEVFPELVVELVWLVELFEVPLVWVVVVVEALGLVVIIVELVWLEVIVVEFVVVVERVVAEVDEVGGIELDVTLVVDVLFVVLVEVEDEVEEGVKPVEITDKVLEPKFATYKLPFEESYAIP